MAGIIKRIIRHFNGTDWDKYYPETSADQVKFTKTDGTETDVQKELSEVNSTLAKDILIRMDTVNAIGRIQLHNGLTLVYGMSLTSTFTNDSETGGYSKIVDLSTYGVKAPLFAMVSARYPGGFPKACIHYIDDTNLKIKIGCDVSLPDVYVSWFVIG